LSRAIEFEIQTRHSHKFVINGAAVGRPIEDDASAIEFAIHNEIIFLIAVAPKNDRAPMEFEVANQVPIEINVEWLERCWAIVCAPPKKQIVINACTALAFNATDFASVVDASQVVTADARE